MWGSFGFGIFTQTWTHFQMDVKEIKWRSTEFMTLESQF